VNSPVGFSELRLIDANANRAREGIRTGEDYIRFVAGEGRWASELKRIRHSVTLLLASHFSNKQLTASRNVGSDPFNPSDATPPPTPSCCGEGDRGVTPSCGGEGAGGRPATESSREVALRGLKRAEEALRVLEEYTRAESAATAVQFAQHRFALYEAEQWLAHASEAAAVIGTASLYVILTKSLCRRGLCGTAEAVLKGGAKLLQFRNKDITNSISLLAEARDLHALCSRQGAVLICNDRLDIALAAGAAGVHLGQHDLPPLDARRVVGEKVIIGRSTHTVEQARHAVELEKADYLGVGSVYDTSTKQERFLVGVKLAEQVCALGLGVPVFAIGGITLDRVAELKAVGVKKVAVSSAIVADPDPERITRRFIELLAA